MNIAMLFRNQYTSWPIYIARDLDSIVEQNAQMALSIAVRGYVMQTGRILSSGSGADLLNSDEIRPAYLGG
jgi:ABC-type branched-subunit amino acid transport system ATPase component